MILKRHNPQKQVPTLRVDLYGDDICECGDITVIAGNEPILQMCRRLIDAGFDPDTPLRCYRNNALALNVRAIGEAACLTINSRGNGFVRLSPARAGSLVRRRRLPFQLPANAKEVAE
jgi:hypothetical protein